MTHDVPSQMRAAAKSDLARRQQYFVWQFQFGIDVFLTEFH